MLTNRVWTILFGGTLALGPASAAETFTSFDFPGATATNAQGINSNGAVVGGYTDSAGKTHGYLLSEGTFTTIDYPGALFTLASGINSQGDVVGYRVDVAGLPGGGNRGFLLQQGSFSDLNYPGHMNTMPVRINDGGTVVGCYHDTDTMGTMRGFVYADGNYSALDGSWGGLNVPASMNRGLMPDGAITVGHYTDMTTNYNHAYLAGGAVLAAFTFPFSLGTSALDINASGEVVGLYTDAAKKVHGYLLELGDSIATLGLTSMLGPFRFTSIDFSGATATQALGINSKGDVVGVYTDSANKNHAFLLTRGRHHQD